MKSSIQQNFEFFENNKPEIIEDFKGKFVVISDQQIQNHFDTRADALKFATSNFDMGSFIIQFVTENETVVQGFFERVSFA